MNVVINLLRRSDQLVPLMRADGWFLEEHRHGAFSANHPLVPDEGAARSRLSRLGILTSGACRIEFEPRSTYVHAGRG